MNKIKPFILYIPAILLLFFFLFIISKGDILQTFWLFNLAYMPYNFLYGAIYYRYNTDTSRLVLFILSILAFLLSFIINEVIRTKINDTKIELSVKNDEVNVEKYNNFEASPVVKKNLNKAEYYLSINDYSSAWIYADIIDDQKTKAEAEKNLKIPKDNDLNDKYIDTLLYQNYVRQNKDIEAYYFCLDNINNTLYDYDFLIKYRNSYLKLLESYYSIDVMESKKPNPGYTDIKFYLSDKTNKLFVADKMVLDGGNRYFYSVEFDGKYYPYLFVSKAGNILTSGFNESERVTILKEDFPDKSLFDRDLTLFSKELYPLVKDSLITNIKMYLYRDIKYLSSRSNTNFIITSIVNYLSIFIIFLIPTLYIGKSHHNYIFHGIVNIFVTRWFINKIGLILINYSLGLSIIFTIIIFIIWGYIVLNKIKLLPSQF